MKYKYVLWDWNGTFLNDVDASLAAVNDILDMYGKPRLDLKTYSEYVATPISRFYERLFDLNNVTMETITPLYNKLYIKHEDKIGLSNGVKEAVALLRKNGVKQYILSAAYTGDILKYVKAFGLENVFERISAANSREILSKIEQGKRLISEENIVPEECVMIGDTEHDLETAKAVGVRCILYSGGHAGQEKLERTGECVFSGINDIVKIIV